MDYIKNNTLKVTGIGIVIIILLWGWTMWKGSESFSGLTTDKSGTQATTYTNKEGSVTVGGNTYPDNWPTDVPKYSNATVQYSAASNPQAEGAASSVIFLTKDSIQSVVDFYKKELVSFGWNVEQVVNTGGTTIIAAKKDTRNFAAYIADSGDGQVSVTVGIELGK